MKIEDLLQNVKVQEINVALATDIAKLSHNSKECKKDGLFFAIRGEKNDGNNYINDVLANGAVAIVTEFKQKSSVPYILVDDVREAMAQIASNLYLNRHRQMRVISVVGTNGKTTTASMISSILRTAGKKVTLIGTLGVFINGKHIECDMTTPDPIILHFFINKSFEEGVEFLIFEASAHAIYYKKLQGIIADIAVFTNFSQDHLDFFETMENYKSVKRSYFSSQNVKLAIVNTDDELGREIYNDKRLYVSGYGLNNPADTFAIDVKYTSSTECLINSVDDIFELTTSFIGEFNLYNTLAAIATARALGIDSFTIQKSFRRLQGVNGRFNIMQSTRRAVIDFAHTPDGLLNLLKEARKITIGQLIVVFGCGGNRDSKKRSIMGRIAAENADFCVLTSDNNRYENPNDIISQIEDGFREISHSYIKIIDRENAIAYALLLAKKDDLVVIAGKGGEDYMEENGIKFPYSDKKVVEEIFRRYNI